MNQSLFGDDGPSDLCPKCSHASAHHNEFHVCTFGGCRCGLDVAPTPPPAVERLRQQVRDDAVGGTTCPVCDQQVKVYKKKMPAVAAATVILLGRLNPAEYGHVPTMTKSLSGTSTMGGDRTLSERWGLIEQQPGLRDDGSSRTGWWRLTARGKDWLEDASQVMSHVILLHGEVLGFDGVLITVKEALGNHFNFDELMTDSRSWRGDR